MSGHETGANVTWPVLASVLEGFLQRHPGIDLRIEVFDYVVDFPGPTRSHRALVPFSSISIDADSSGVWVPPVGAVEMRFAQRRAPVIVRNFAQ
jgi:hypothetical protein